MNTNEANAFAQEIDQLTQNNSHTEARIAVSKKLNQDDCDFAEQFQTILDAQEKDNYLSNANSLKRDELTDELLLLVEILHGTEVRKIIYSVL